MGWYRALQKQSGVQIAGGPATRKKDARDGGSLFRGGVYARSMPRRTTTTTRRRRLLLLRSAVLVARAQVPTFRVRRLRRYRSFVSRQLNCIMMVLTAIFLVQRSVVLTRWTWSAYRPARIQLLIHRSPFGIKPLFGN